MNPCGRIARGKGLQRALKDDLLVRSGRRTSWCMLGGLMGHKIATDCLAWSAHSCAEGYRSRPTVSVSLGNVCDGSHGHQAGFAGINPPRSWLKNICCSGLEQRSVISCRYGDAVALALPPTSRRTKGRAAPVLRDARVPEFGSDIGWFGTAHYGARVELTALT